MKKQKYLYPPYRESDTVIDYSFGKGFVFLKPAGRKSATVRSALFFIFIGYMIAQFVDAIRVIG